MGDPSEYLDEVEAQLVALTERGAHRTVRARAAGALIGPDGAPRVRVGVDAIGLGVSVMVALTIAVVGLTSLHAGGGAPSRPSGGAPGTHSPAGGNGSPPAPLTSSGLSHHALRHHHRHAGPPSTTVTGPAVTPGVPAHGGPVPPGFGPESFTAISDQEWWLLGTAPCSNPSCVSILRTVDGGRTFVGTPAPPTTQVNQLRFADQLDGFAFGPQLWVTHSGAQAWSRVKLPGTVEELAASNGFVYAIVRSGNSGVLMRSPVDTDGWVALPAAGNALDGLWVQGNNVLLESTGRSGLAQLIVSHDDGASFARHPGPTAVVACSYQEEQAPVIWAHCATGMLSGVWRSTNDGRSFTRMDGAKGARLPELPNSAAFSAATGDTAVVGYNQLYVTTDGGAGYSRVSGPEGIRWWSYIGFTDGSHGAAIGYTGAQTPANARLYYTTDGGLSYAQVKLPGA